MEMIPAHLEIELIKIDVQGVDLEAAQSAGKHLRRGKKYVVEIQGGKNDGTRTHLLYEGEQGVKEDAIKFFEANGFKHNEKQSRLNNPSLDEWDVVFDRID